VDKDKDRERDKAIEEKGRALDSAMSQITKSYGKGAIMKLGEHFAQRSEVTAISTGALPLDLALGVGGIPRGRVTEIYGPESAGKTTLALHVIAEAQKAGGVAAFVDAEHALDPLYASRIGVKIDDLLISQPDTGEQALEIASRTGGRPPRRRFVCSSQKPVSRPAPGPGRLDSERLFVYR